MKTRRYNEPPPPFNLHKIQPHEPARVAGFSRQQGERKGSIQRKGFSQLERLDGDVLSVLTQHSIDEGIDDEIEDVDIWLRVERSEIYIYIDIKRVRRRFMM